jgi:hypothetical protein
LTGQLLNLGAKDCDAVMELLVLVVGGSALTELAARPLLATIGSTTKLGSDAIGNYNSTFTEASYTKYRTFPPKGHRYCFIAVDFHRLLLAGLPAQSVSPYYTL